MAGETITQAKWTANFRFGSQLSPNFSLFRIQRGNYFSPYIRKNDSMQTQGRIKKSWMASFRHRCAHPHYAFSAVSHQQAVSGLVNVDLRPAWLVNNGIEIPSM